MNQKIMWIANGAIGMVAGLTIELILDITKVEGLMILLGSWILLNQLTGFVNSEENE